MATGGNRSGGSEPAMGIRYPVMTGLTVIFLFFVVFLGWAAVAPLGSAAIAPGKISVEGNLRTIQHFEGGIVKSINVRDGDFVKKGQILVVLDATQTQASLELVRGRKIVAMAQMARLVAERDGAEVITFPAWLDAHQDEPLAIEAMIGERHIMVSRRTSKENQRGILARKIGQHRQEVRGLKEQIKSADRQIELIGEEIKVVSSLVSKGLSKMPRLRALQRTEAEISGNRGQNIARVAQAYQAIDEVELQINDLDSSFMSKVVKDLRDVQSEIFDLTEKERAALDVFDRISIRAGVDGIVVNMKVHTTGGTVAPGAPIMDIVPADEPLIVEARVKPDDIDVVHKGLAAHIRFPAFSQRSTMPVEGAVKSVSADSLTDERTGVRYYLARVSIGSLEKANLKLSQLRPGMQADVMILTGERTALDYFTAPIVRSFGRALRED